jgi:stage II sporulation protein AA (anti-sigma F factor antagonist)
MNTFSISQRDLRVGCRVIEVAGELDLAVADQLRSAIVGLSSDTEVVVISLERCEFIDSTGLAVILAAHNEFEQSGRRLVACAPGHQVERILSVTGLMDNGFVFESVEDAAAG